MEEVIQIDRTKGQWYIVQVLSGQERRVLSRLKGKIKEADGEVPVHEVLIPMEIVSEIRQGKKQKTQPKIIFPGYVYVRMDLYKEDGALDEQAWFFVKDVQGVINFLGGQNPVALSATEVEDLIRQTEESNSDGPVQTKIPPYVVIGGTVRITEGAFANFDGVVEEIDQEHGKLKLMVSIFGRSTPVELEFWQVGPDEE